VYFGGVFGADPVAVGVGEVMLVVTLLLVAFV